MRELGKKRVFYSAFTPDYFLPGVDRKNYPDLYELLSDQEFVLIVEAIAMYSNLEVYSTQGNI